MWGVVPSIEKYKFKIIEYLFSQKSPVTIREISNVLMISSRSVSYYLSSIKKICGDLNGELLTSSEGIKIKLPVHIGLDHFQRTVFRNTESFRLMEKLFFEGVVTKKEMSGYLYISPSTLDRVLRNLNASLKKFGLSVNTSPLYVYGEERMIRAFYISYFQEAYSVTEWPFHNLDEIILKQIIEKLAGPSQFEQTSFNIIEYRNTVAVYATRALSHHLLEENKNFSFEDDKWLKDIVSSLDFTDEQLHSCYIELLSMYHFFTDIFTSDQVAAILKYNDEVKDITRIVDTLSKQFSLPPHVKLSRFDIHQINFKITYYGKGLSYCKSSGYLLFKPREYRIVTIYQHQYFPFYNSIYRLLTEMFNERKIHFDDEMIKNIISSIILKWINLTKYLFYQFNSCRLLVYNHSTDSIALSLSQELQNTLRRFIEVEAISGREISERRLQKYDFDILITSTTLLLNIKQPVFYLHRLPDFSFRVDELEMIIDSIMEKKREQLLLHE